jgi:aspartyl-tRNA synthetase
MHHPFTSPKPEDLGLMDTDPGRVRARAYDLVMNGSEIGGGSIRIFNPTLQRKMFTLLGIEEAEAQEKFGFLLTALRYGTPPHGGIALGFDRVVAMLAGRSSIRDILAFPKNQNGRDLMADCPSPVAPKQLRDLRIRLVEDEPKPKA